jgi:hypothetical protein
LLCGDFVDNEDNDVESGDGGNIIIMNDSDIVIVIGEILAVTT